jgi:hypothetical protein
MENPNNRRPITHANGYKNGELTKVCVHCGVEKPISEFGYRNMGNGTQQDQSWCKECR